MRVKKIVPLSLKSNRMVPDPDGIYALISDIMEKADLDSASVEFVKNDNKDGNEADEYILIECSHFQLQLTKAELEGLQERFDNQPHIRRHVLPKVKEVKTDIPKKSKKKESKK